MRCPTAARAPCAGATPRRSSRGAEIIDSARLMRGNGIDDADLSRINWADLIKHKHGFTDPVPASIENGLAGNGVDTLHGHARFTGPNTLTVDGSPYEAAHFLVATGRPPSRPLAFPGHEHLVDSTQFMILAVENNCILSKDADILPPALRFVCRNCLP